MMCRRAARQDGIIYCSPQANTEAMQHFAAHLKQCKANCDALQNIERNLAMTASGAARAALRSSGHIIQTDDGAQWQAKVLA